jgi:signal peptidase
MIRISKWIAKILVVFLVLILLFNLYFPISARLSGIKYPALFGIRQAVVMSGSMEPAVEIGDLIVIRLQNKYREGDIITYFDKQRLVTHRVMSVQSDQLLTQGDANNTPDSPIDTKQVLGRMIIRLPHVASFFWFLRTPLGCALSFIFGLIIIQWNRLIPRSGFF